MQTITPSEALDALKSRNITDEEVYEIVGEPDKLSERLYVYFVKVWRGDWVDWVDVMFVRNNGKVMVHNA